MFNIELFEIESELRWLLIEQTSLITAVESLKEKQKQLEIKRERLEHRLAKIKTFSQEGYI